MLQVWVSFGLAALLCGTGLAYLPGADLDRVFMVRGYMFDMKPTSIRRALVRASLAVLIASRIAAASAQSGVSELSALSALPIVVSVTAPVMVLSPGATLTVVAVEASATGTVWVLERASDGARASLRFGARAVGGLSAAAGTAVVITAISTGWVLSVASEAIAFVPNEIGSALLYDERITR